MEFQNGKGREYISVFNLTLGLSTGATSARNIDSTTTIGSKKLLAGAKIIIPYRQLHYEEDAFGPAVHTWNPARFIDKKELQTSPYFRRRHNQLLWTLYCQKTDTGPSCCTNYDVELEDSQKGPST